MIAIEQGAERFEAKEAPEKEWGCCEEAEEKKCCEYWCHCDLFDSRPVQDSCDSGLCAVTAMMKLDDACGDDSNFWSR